MRLIFLLIFYEFVGGILYAQTATEDAQRVLAPLLNAPHLYYENRYFYYEEGKKTPVDTLEGIVQRAGGHKYMRMGTIEILALENIVVTADHEDRIVSAQPIKAEQNLDEIVDVKKLQGLLKRRELTVQYVADRGNWKAVSMVDPERKNDKMIIYYDPSTWIIQEARITTNDPYASPVEKSGKVTIVVQYLKYSTAQKTFSYKLENYVRKNGKGYTATGKCRGYRVI